MVHPLVRVIVGDERFCRWGVFGAAVSQIHVCYRPRTQRTAHATNGRLETDPMEHSVGTAAQGGGMRTRRPYRYASIEYAPGPRRISAMMSRQTMIAAAALMPSLNQISPWQSNPIAAAIG